MPKDKPHTAVRCLECRHATLYRYYDNPVLARCRHCKYPNVAAASTICNEYEPRLTPPRIARYTYSDNPYK